MYTINFVKKKKKKKSQLQFYVYVLYIFSVCEGRGVQVFVRAALQVIKADSVGASELADVKKPSTSEHPC